MEAIACGFIRDPNRLKPSDVSTTVWSRHRVLLLSVATILSLGWMTQGFFGSAGTAGFAMLILALGLFFWKQSRAVSGMPWWPTTTWEWVWWTLALAYGIHGFWATSPQGTVLAMLEAISIAVLIRVFHGFSASHPKTGMVKDALMGVSVAWIALWLLTLIVDPSASTLDGRLALGFGEADVTAAWFLGVWWIAVDGAVTHRLAPWIWQGTVALSALVLVATTSRGVWLIWGFGLGWFLWQQRHAATALPVIGWTLWGMAIGLLWWHLPVVRPYLWSVPTVSLWLGHTRFRLPFVSVRWVRGIAIGIGGVVLLALIPHLIHLLHSGSPLTSRWAMWVTAWRIFLHHPWGLGAHTFRNIYGRFETWGWVSEYPHSVYWSWLDNLGVMALVPFGLLAWTIRAWFRQMIQGAWMSALPLALAIHAGIDVDAAFPLWLGLWAMSGCSDRSLMRTVSVSRRLQRSSKVPECLHVIAMGALALSAWATSTLLLAQSGRGFDRAHQPATALTLLTMAHTANPWSPTISQSLAEAQADAHQPWQHDWQASLQMTSSNAAALPSAIRFLVQHHQNRAAESLAEALVHETPWQATGYLWVTAFALTTSVHQPITAPGALAQDRLATETALAFFRHVNAQPRGIRLRNETAAYEMPIAVDGFFAAVLANQPEQANSFKQALPHTRSMRQWVLLNLALMRHHRHYALSTRRHLAILLHQSKFR